MRNNAMLIAFVRAGKMPTKKATQPTVSKPKPSKVQRLGLSSGYWNHVKAQQFLNDSMMVFGD
jgi:hypothetical protein